MPERVGMLLSGLFRTLKERTYLSVTFTNSGLQIYSEDYFPWLHLINHRGSSASPDPLQLVLTPSGRLCGFPAHTASLTSGVHALGVETDDAKAEWLLRRMRVKALMELWVQIWQAWLNVNSALIYALTVALNKGREENRTVFFCVCVCVACSTVLLKAATRFTIHKELHRHHEPTRLYQFEYYITTPLLLCSNVISSVQKKYVMQMPNKDAIDRHTHNCLKTRYGTILTICNKLSNFYFPLCQTLATPVVGVKIRKS